MQNKPDFWSIKQMIEYAELSYHINPEFFHSMNENKISDISATNYNNCEKQFQRTIKKYKMASVNPDTDKLDYELPEPVAKCFVDTIMQSYFHDIIYNSEDMVAEYYNEKDEVQFQKSSESFEVYQTIVKAERDGEDISEIESSYPRDYSYSIDNYIKINADIEDENKAIDRLMLHAIFNHMFEFNESAYRQDYEKYLNLHDDSHPHNPYDNGYSECKEKLDHPEKYYYQLKEKK